MQLSVLEFEVQTFNWKRLKKNRGLVILKSISFFEHYLDAYLRYSDDWGMGPMLAEFSAGEWL